MNRSETLQVMTLLATTTGPVPEGPNWDLTAVAWAAVFADLSVDEALRAIKLHCSDTRPTSETDPRPRGRWWPQPADLFAKIQPGGGNEEAWLRLVPVLHATIPEAIRRELTDDQRRALQALPGAFDRARMSAREIAGLRGRFLAGCTPLVSPPSLTADPNEAARIPERVPLVGHNVMEDFARRAFTGQPVPSPLDARQDDRSRRVGSPRRRGSG